MNFSLKELIIIKNLVRYAIDDIQTYGDILEYNEIEIYNKLVKCTEGVKDEINRREE